MRAPAQLSGAGAAARAQAGVPAASTRAQRVETAAISQPLRRSERLRRAARGSHSPYAAVTQHGAFRVSTELDGGRGAKERLLAHQAGVGPERAPPQPRHSSRNRQRLSLMPPHSPAWWLEASAQAQRVGRERPLRIHPGWRVLTAPPRSPASAVPPFRTQLAERKEKGNHRLRAEAWRHCSGRAVDNSGPPLLRLRPARSGRSADGGSGVWRSSSVRAGGEGAAFAAVRRR